MTENLVQMLQESTRRYGNRPAMFFKPSLCYQQWSYRQLWEESGRAASFFRQKGIQKGDRVLLWAPNRPEWAAGYFGYLRAGAIVVPLDMRNTWDFVARVTEKTQPRLALISRFTPDCYKQLEMPKIYLEDLREAIKDSSSSPEIEPAPDNLAEIMFTSGTTGDPKGVMITHRNLISNVDATLKYLPCTTSNRFLSLLPLSHLFEQTGGFLVPLRAGSSITYLGSRQPAVIFRTLREQHITHILLVPQALDMFIKGIEREVRRHGKERIWNILLNFARHMPFGIRRLMFRQLHKRMGGSMDLLVSGGAALDRELKNKWEMMGFKVIQGYGATEASPIICCQTKEDRSSDSVGRPLPGVEVFVAPDGEVMVKGPNITPGYWEAPEKTASCFEAGIYKTGDVGFVDEKGHLHIKGRKKDMLALPDGQKVFPEDIEAVLKKHPAVTDAAVLGIPRGHSIEIHAALILQEPSTAEEVIVRANSQLAERQQIKGFTVWQEQDFPRTHTLKVKKNIILDMLTRQEQAAIQRGLSALKDAPPQHDNLLHILSEISGEPVHDITPEKNLGNDLHLDSLKRVELLSAIEEELGVYIDEMQIGPYTTAGQLRSLVAKGSGEQVVTKFPSWGRKLWCRVIREILQQAIAFPMLKVSYSLNITGRETLKDMDRPLLFAANHSHHLDNGLILKALPSRWRRRLAIAARAQNFRSLFWRIVYPLAGNGFPFSQEGAIRPSLNNLGRILDEGWSVLIYPEGKLTIGGPIQSFKSGTGFIAVETQVPVVPLKLVIQKMGRPWQLPFLERGSIEVRFGRPVTFPPNISYIEATAQLEQAVNAL